MMSLRKHGKSILTGIFAHLKRGFRVQYIFDMQKENQKPSHNDVMPSVANFLSSLWFEGEFRDQPKYLIEIFDIILESEIGNTLDIRTKMIGCIKTSQMLAKALEPFSDKQIEIACNKVINA
jgi:hypothetical protein